MTVDDAVERYVRVLWSDGELANTYIFYFSDYGFHMGNHALPKVTEGRGGKNTPYTEDVEFPLIVRGPRITPNTSDHHLVSNTDLAPTFADTANAVPRMQGQSVPWRDALLVEGKHDKPWPEGRLATRPGPSAPRSRVGAATGGGTSAHIGFSVPATGYATQTK